MHKQKGKYCSNINALTSYLLEGGKKCLVCESHISGAYSIFLPPTVKPLTHPQKYTKATSIRCLAYVP